MFFYTSSVLFETEGGRERMNRVHNLYLSVSICNFVLLVYNKAYHKRSKSWPACGEHISQGLLWVKS